MLLNKVYIYLLTFLFAIFYFKVHFKPCLVSCVLRLFVSDLTQLRPTLPKKNVCFGDLSYCLWWGLEPLEKPSGLMTLLTKHFIWWMIWTQLLLIIREEWSSVKNKENLVDLKSSFLQIWFTKNLLHWTLLYNLPKQNHVQGHKISTYPRLSLAIWLLNKLKLENKSLFWASFFRLLTCNLLYKVL